MKHVKGKMKFLAVKLSALQSELKVSKEILQSAAKEVDIMFKKKYFPEVPVKQPEVEPSVPVEKTDEAPKSEAPKQESQNHQEQKEVLDRLETDKKDIDPEVKSIFRKIALKIHPDKLVSLPDGYEKDKKQELYSKAMQAMENNDLIILADIAIEIGIDPPEIDEDRLKKTEEKINAIKKELKHIESTIVWQWFFCTDSKQKDTILKKLFELMYEKKSRS